MSPADLPRLRRLPVMVLLAALHLGCYLAVTRINAARDPAALWSLATPLDRMIPHLPLTWPLYWLTYPFVVLGTGWALWVVGDRRYLRGVVAIVVVTLSGALIQLAIPSRAPWPADAGAIMQHYHTAGLVLPFANLPSMHVTYSVLAAGMLVEVTASRTMRWGAIAIAAAITVSTVTLKEHFVLDAISGLALALVALAWWRMAPVTRSVGATG
jgi:hypothetical protein